MNHKKILNNLLFFATVVALLAGILTIVPWLPAKESNIIGYKSICSFTPASTAICLFLANTFYSIRKKLSL